MKTCTSCGKTMDDNYAVCPYCGSAVNAGAPYGNPQPGYAPPAAPVNPPEYTPVARPQRSAYIAAILCFFGGGFGFHQFYLDRKNKGLIMLLVSLLTCGFGAAAMQIWALVDMVRLLRGDINTDGKGEIIKMGF